MGAHRASAARRRAGAALRRERTHERASDAIRPSREPSASAASSSCCIGRSGSMPNRSARARSSARCASAYDAVARRARRRARSTTTGARSRKIAAMHAGADRSGRRAGDLVLSRSPKRSPRSRVSRACVCTSGPRKPRARAERCRARPARKPYIDRDGAARRGHSRRALHDRCDRRQRARARRRAPRASTDATRFAAMRSSFATRHFARSRRRLASRSPRIAQRVRFSQANLLQLDTHRVRALRLHVLSATC